jgi:phosphoribosylformimino-5-aminoimidazole carboxamide ribotide isomerase
MILGADVRNGKISINGWKEDSTEDLLPFLKKYIEAGVKTVLCTEISKDGTLQGPAIELYKEVMAAYPQLHLIASGGVSSIDDIRALDAAGIPAVVFGKAIYEGRIDLRELKIENSSQAKRLLTSPSGEL